MTIKVGEIVTIEEVLANEGRQIFDRKSINIEPKVLAVPMIAFANADGKSPLHRFSRTRKPCCINAYRTKYGCSCKSS